MGAPDGYQELVRQETPALFRRALLLAHDWHLAEDLVQETAMTALTKWRQVRAADNPAAYLHTILTNHFLTRTRKHSYLESPTEIEVPGSVDPWPGIDAEIEVANGLACLTPLERAVVVARYLDDQPASKVAEQLGRQETWVRVTAHRALGKMRTQLSQPEPEDADERTTARGRRGFARRTTRGD
ncbi:sigma-70 family RNA polymerase sigma factor [Brooklawnia cerclae]|uniref:RNA polymerase sigma factor (Sigma-70 family) n=1 Tax=Brooklawnia cerclae TaxID=349934 RepID=A0ABX0SAE7_9ACTN|nr:RNA polymerase sigma factor (sigma-70 family) [Brooklawnia cerclae]